MKAVILVGGEGTRLRPLTLTCPKPMLPLGNVPFLEHMLAHLRRHGIDDVVLAMGYLPDRIERHFGDGSAFGVRLTYEVESKPLGTAGAARNALQHLDDTCFVFNGDVFTTIDLSVVLAAHRARGAEVTITLTAVEDPSRFGVVVRDRDHRVTAFIEKPPRDQAPTNLINAGIYVLEPQVLEAVPPGEFSMFEKGLFVDLVAAGRPFYAEAPGGYWIDIGTPAQYLEANRDYAAGRIDSGLPRRATTRADQPADVLFGEGGVIEADACLVGPGVIGSNVRLGARCQVTRSVLLDDARIGPDAVVRDSIVGRGAVVAAGATLLAESVIADQGRVGVGSTLIATRVWPRTQVPRDSHLEGAVVMQEATRA